MNIIDPKSLIEETILRICTEVYASTKEEASSCSPSAFLSFYFGLLASFLCFFTCERWTVNFLSAVVASALAVSSFPAVKIIFTVLLVLGMFRPQAIVSGKEKKRLEKFGPQETNQCYEFLN